MDIKNPAAPCICCYTTLWNINVSKTSHSPSFSSVLAKRKSARENHVLACNFGKYSPTLIFFFTRRLSSKPFLIWLLITPPHLKYVATLPCNLSLMSTFSVKNWQNYGHESVAPCFWPTLYIRMPVSDSRRDDGHSYWDQNHADACTCTRRQNKTANFKLTYQVYDQQIRPEA